MLTRAAIWPSGTRIVWRSLTWGEYRKARSHQGLSAEKALEVYEACVIEGPRVDEVPAGIMMWIYTNEMEKTPFTGTFESLSMPLEQARARVTGTFLLSAQALIASVFKVPFESMDSWDGNTFLTRLAQAEFVAGVPLNPVDNKNPKNPANKKVRKKALTPAQEIAIQRKNDQANQGGGGKANFRPSIRSKV